MPIFTSSIDYTVNTMNLGVIGRSQDVSFNSAESLLLDHGFDQAAVEALFEYHAQFDRAGFQYPWGDLEKRLADNGVERIYLVGYGSLLNPESAKRTVRNTPRNGHPPVVAFGARRVFNYRIPDIMFERYGVAQERSIALP